MATSLTASHTPGPWTVGSPTVTRHDYPEPYDSETVCIRGATGASVANVGGGHQHVPYVSLEQGRANARLIAAAPELFSALTIDDIETLIEAVENFVIGPDETPEMRDLWGPYVGKLNALKSAIAKAEGR